MQDQFIGRVLRALRHRQGWRQADLADAASVSRSLIAALEAGELERGSIDLLAWHPTTRTLLVIEIKTVIVDVGGLLATIDRKVRLARTIARDRGWEVSAVVPTLVVAEGSTARRRIAEHAALFGRFAVRGRAAMRWVRDPGIGRAAFIPTGLLVLTKLSDAHPGDRRRAGRQRMRRAKRDPRSAPPGEVA